MTARVLTAGETMALLDPVADEIGLGATYRLRIGGAESNFAIALRRLGVETRWASILGADQFGDLVQRTLAAEGLDVGWVRRDSARPPACSSSRDATGRHG